MVRILAFIFLSSIFYIEAKPDPTGKGSIDLDEELEIEIEAEKSTESEANDEEIIIQGEDEEIIGSKKDDSTAIKPNFDTKTNWSSPEEELVLKEKKKNKSIEKTAQIMAEYGYYNSLGIDIFITKRSQSGAYLLEYSREKYDREGINNHVVSNSDQSFDYLNFITGLNLAQNYRLFIKTSFEDKQRGLQQNAQYSTISKRAWLFDVQNQWRPTSSQKLNLGLSGQYILSDLSGLTASDDNSRFSKGKAMFNWDYNLGPNNAIFAEVNFWYAESKIYSNNSNIFRVIDFNLWDNFTLLRNYIGKEKNLWQLDLPVGVSGYYSIERAFWAGPLLQINNVLGNWNSKITLRRPVKFPSFYTGFMQNIYNEPVNVANPESYWEVEWQNNISIGQQVQLKTKLAQQLHDVYYEPTQSNRNLFNVSSRSLNLTKADVSVSYLMLSYLKFELGGFSNYTDSTINLLPLWGGTSKVELFPSNWNFILEFQYVSSREINGAALPKYLLMNAKIEHQINETVQFFIRGDNLSNQGYTIWPTYETSGLKIYSGLNILI